MSVEHKCMTVQNSIRSKRDLIPNRPGKSGQEDPARGMSTTKSHLFIYLSKRLLLPELIPASVAYKSD